MKSKLVLSLLVTVIAFFSIGPQLNAQVDQSNRQLTQGPSQQPQTSPRRRALVIGNGDYQHVGRLANPPNDATLVSASLRQLGFEVTNGSNLTQREMKQRIREFGQALRANGGVGLFYFAGHGVQAKGHNYLVPVDADIQTEADLEDVAVDLNYVLNLMDDAQNSLNIVILDACRNNPFARSFRSAQEGLAQVKAPTGTLIAYATAPDSIAADGTGTNSPYTQELIKAMQSSGVLVETMFRRVTEQVSARTNGKQEPWFSANVKGDFYFIGVPIDSTASSTATNPTTISRLDPAAIELTYWDSIKSSANPEDFKAYLEKYPEGQFAALAKNKINSVEAPARPESRSSTGSEATEIAFWDSIKNSTNVEDFRAYLRKYPDGQFLSLAANRIKVFEDSNARLSDLGSSPSREITASADVYQKRGDALRAQKKYGDAVTEYLAAVRIRPDLAEAQYHLGWIYNELKQYSEALGPLKAAIRSNPNDPTAQSELGYAYRSLKQYEEALSAYKEAIRLKPDYADALYSIGWIYNELNKFDQAVEPLKRAISLKRDYTEAYNELGYAYRLLKRYAEAIESLKEAVRLKHDSALAHYGLGLSYLAIGDAANAMKEYKTLQKLDPDKASQLYKEINK